MAVHIIAECGATLSISAFIYEKFMVFSGFLSGKHIKTLFNYLILRKVIDVAIQIKLFL